MKRSATIVMFSENSIDEESCHRIVKLSIPLKTLSTGKYDNGMNKENEDADDEFNEKANKIAKLIKDFVQTINLEAL